MIDIEQTDIKRTIRDLGQQIYEIDAEIELCDSHPSYENFRKIALLRTQKETLRYTQRWWMERELAQEPLNVLQQF